MRLSRYTIRHPHSAKLGAGCGSERVATCGSAASAEGAIQSQSTTRSWSNAGLPEPLVNAAQAGKLSSSATSKGLQLTGHKGSCPGGIQATKTALRMPQWGLQNGRFGFAGGPGERLNKA